MTKIEWTHVPGYKGESLNPFRARVVEPTNDGAGRERIGWHCEHVSEGCRNCYAERMNGWRGTGLEFKPGNRRHMRKGYTGSGIEFAEPFLDEKTLLKPLSWRKARAIFWCDMTDTFGDWVPDEWLDKLWAVFALTPQHIHMVLTKRPERMRAYMSPKTGVGGRVVEQALRIKELPHAWGWPLPNVWLGTSTEDQKTADQRIPDLLATPAAVLFISAEPLLGPVNLFKVPGAIRSCGTDICATKAQPHELAEVYSNLDWVITGGESGPNARPAHPDWFRVARDACQAAGVPYFLKQLGTKSGTRDRKGGDWSEWPDDLRVREWPSAVR